VVSVAFREGTCSSDSLRSMVPKTNRVFSS
jgi:hypothetical protein